MQRQTQLKHLLKKFPVARDAKVQMPFELPRSVFSSSTAPNGNIATGINIYTERNGTFRTWHRSHNRLFWAAHH